MSSAATVGRKASASNMGRKMRMMAEMGWVTLGLTIQLYVLSNTGWWTVCGMLVLYILWFSRRLQGAPGIVYLLPLAMALGVLGGWNTGTPEDIWEPIHMALASLAVLGVFAAEYNREEDAQFLAFILVFLMPVAVWQSIARNNLWEEWSVGGRKGVNLQALFLMVGASYGLLLRGGFKLVVLPFYGAIFLLGSRTGFFTSLTLPMVYFAFVRRHRKQPTETFPVLALAILLISCAIVLCPEWIPRDTDESGGLLPKGLVVEGRYSAESVKEVSEKRAEMTRRWLEFLLEEPTLFGHGCRSYGWFFGGECHPHNGFLHVFNGYGVIAGCLYLSVCLTTVRSLWMKRQVLPPHLLWAGAFFVSMVLRQLAEAQLLVVAVHVSGFAIMYAAGLAIRRTSVSDAGRGSV